MFIHVAPLHCVIPIVRDHAIPRVVSIVSNPEDIPAIPGLPRERHLQLCFHDLSAERHGLMAPDHTHIRELLDFVLDSNQEEPLLIHCWAGISRSTAGAFITLCARNPEVSPLRIAEALRNQSPTATPNPRMVGLADALLGYDDRMLEATKAIGMGRPASSGDPFFLPLIFPLTEDE